MKCTPREKCIQRLRGYRYRVQGVELFDSNFRTIFSSLAIKKQIRIPYALDYNVKATYDAYKKVIDECDDKEIIDLHWNFEMYIIDKRQR